MERQLSFSRRSFLKLACFSSFSLGVSALGFEPPELGVLPEYKVKETRTPESLMLHTSNEPLVNGLVNFLKENGYSTATYKSMLNEIVSGKTLPDKMVLISIDDLALEWLNPAYERMVNCFTKAGFVGTLGIVTRGDPKKGVIDKLTRMKQNGWELAMYTENHLDLGKATYKTIFNEVSNCKNKIKKFFGVDSSTLILPYGLLWDNKGNVNKDIFRVCSDLGVLMVVGIVGGKKFGGSPPYYFGRISPDSRNNLENTINMLKNSFD